MKNISAILCWVTFLCDLLLSIVVCLLLGYGVWVFIPLVHVLDEIFVITTFLVLISFALMISLASLIGCIGVARKNSGILFGSASFNTFVLLLLFNFIISICFSHLTIEDKLKADMQDSLESYNKNCSNGYSSPGWDTLQNEYECCGVENYTDWLNRTEESTPPYSCALKEARYKQSITFLADLRKSVLPNNIFKIGCFSSIKQSIYNNKFKLFLIAGLFELLTIFAITLTCYLGKKIRDIDMYYDPLLGHEDYELTKIVRNHQNQNGRNKNGTLKSSKYGTSKSSKFDRIRIKEDPNQNLAKIIQDDRLINFTVL